MKTLLRHSAVRWGALLALPVIALMLSGVPAAAAHAITTHPHLDLLTFGLAGTTLTDKWPNILDVAQRTDPNGAISKVVEILAPVNEILDDIPFFECNDGTGHKTTIRTGIPDPQFRKLYGGTQPLKSTTVQVRHATGMMESYAEIDVALAQLSGNAAAFRLSEERAFIQGFGKKMATTVFYGNEATVPEGFTGLAPHYAAIAGVESGDNVVDGLGTGSDNTSIWLVQWGEDSVHGLYPRGSKGGLQVQDKGQVTVENVDGANGRAEMYRTHYRWDAGITLRNWKSAVRIANIDVSDLDTAANTKVLINLMIEASEKLDNPNAGRVAWYVNRKIRTKLRIGIQEKIGNNLSWETVAGKRVMMFDDTPVRRCDALLNTEARIT
jgi:hypothetical protein